MPCRFRLAKGFGFWRCVYLISAVFVFSYIAFDVLDLDLSDFPLSHTPREKTAIVTEVPKITGSLNAGNPDGFRIAPSLLEPPIFKDSLQSDLLRVPRFRKFLISFHPLIIPRSSSEPSPAH